MSSQTMDANSNLSSDSTPCTATIETCYGGADLISELPDSLLHLILSFLDMKLVIQTSILAKRWRYLWTTLPYLKFSEEVYCNSIASLGKMPSFEAFMDFVGRVLLLHNGSDVQSFYLSFKDYTPQMAMFVDESDLLVDFEGLLNIKYKTFELPQCLFTFKSLTTLNLDMGARERPILELPHSVDLPSLRSLYFRTLRFVGGESLGKFISSFPVLEVLFIVNCVLQKPENFIISVLQLKKLALHAFCLDDCLEHCRITVSAPNLKFLHCRMGLQDYHFDDFTSLDYANVDIFSHKDMIKSNALLLPWDKLEAQNAMKCLRVLCNVKSLQLSDSLLENAMEALAGLPSMITTSTFCNLSSLKMKVYHSPCSIRTITIFLEKCPKVETLILVIDQMPLCECFDEKKFYLEDGEECYSEAEVSLQCMLYHLKFVEILDVRGNVYELNLLGFLLKNAMVLEKMTVTTSKELPPSAERRLEFKEMLVAFPRASSKAEISFF